MLTESARLHDANPPELTPRTGEFSRAAGKFPVRRVLVVDDESLVRWSVSETLESRGYEVVEAPTGADAVRLVLERAPFAAILLDLQLPDCADLRLLGLLHSFAPTTPIVLMSAFVSPEIEAEAAWVGADRVLRKPFDLAALAALVDILGRDERPDDPRR